MRNTNISTKKSAPHSADTTAQAAARPFPSVAARVRRAAAAAGLGRGGFVDDARRAATPHIVDCHGLSRENLGDEPYRFESEFHQRRAWCENCGGLFEIEPIRHQRASVLTGYRFRFAQEADAESFKCRFDTNL
jgi:hypothetical protein